MSDTPTFTKRERFWLACVRVYLYLLDRLVEPSTLRGIVMAAGGLCAWFGVAKIDHIIAVTSLVVGALGALMPDKLRKKAKAAKESE